MLKTKFGLLLIWSAIPISPQSLWLRLQDSHLAASNGALHCALVPGILLLEDDWVVSSAGIFTPRNSQTFWCLLVLPNPVSLDCWVGSTGRRCSSRTALGNGATHCDPAGARTLQQESNRRYKLVFSRAINCENSKISGWGQISSKTRQSVCRFKRQWVESG